jgi:argininosuccinate lyase
MTKLSHSSNASVIWGGRFADGPSAIMKRINVSINFDKKLYHQDIAGSKAHCTMLLSTGILSKSEAETILKGLDLIENEIDTGLFNFKEDYEDIHMNIEARLAELIGETAGRLHTARSRNDQVATDFRLWVRDSFDSMDQALQALQNSLLEQAELYAAVIMPGFTHLQIAQPITFGHHLLAYVEMFGRDRSRLQDGRRRLNECPLGAAALAGTSFPIDRHQTSTLLGFDHPARNSLDAVSDRDFALEFLSICAICAIHLSRLAEEIVLWTSPQFSFVTLSDAFTTGSSIMPQKRNPDAAELVRAKAGRIIGALNSLLIMMKGLPLAYSKDMQEDKEPVFEAADIMALSIAAMEGMIADMKANESQMKKSAQSGFSTATDMADWLVRVVHIPFRQAHHITGQAIKLAEEKGCDLADLSLQDFQLIDQHITADLFTVLDPEHSVASRRSYGGTAPELVRQAVFEARKRYLP